MRVFSVRASNPLRAFCLLHLFVYCAPFSKLRGFTKWARERAAASSQSPGLQCLHLFEDYRRYRRRTCSAGMLCSGCVRPSLSLSHTHTCTHTRAKGMLKMHAQSRIKLCPRCGQAIMKSLDFVHIQLNHFLCGKHEPEISSILLTYFLFVCFWHFTPATHTTKVGVVLCNVAILSHST